MRSIKPRSEKRAWPLFLQLVVLGCCLASGAASAVTCTATTGLWNVAGTWSCGNVPANGDSVVIPNGATVTLDVNTNRLVDLNVNAGGILQGDNTGKILTIDKGGGTDVTNNGQIQFGAGKLATIFLRRASQWTGGGTWNLSVIELNAVTLTFPTAPTFTINMSGAAAPIIITTGFLTSPATVSWNFSGAVAQTLPTSANVVYGDVTVSNTSGVTLGVAMTSANLLGHLTVATGGILNNAGLAITLAADKNFAVNAGGRFNLTGTSAMVAVSGAGTKTFGATSTVNYQGGNQTVSVETYGHLILDGGSTKTPAGTTTVAGNFTLGTGTTYAGNTNNPVVNLAGNFSNSGTFNSGTGTFTFNGAAAQTLTGATTFTNMRMNNTATGLTINNNVTVSSVLTLTSGVVTTGANTLITTANCPGSVSRTSGHIAGFLRLQVPAGAGTCVHHVGDSTTYRPISLTFPTTTTAGNLTGWVSQAAGDHADIAASGLDSNQSVNRYWTLTNGGVGLGGGGYSATFTFVAGDVDTGADTSQFEVARRDGTIWFTTTAGTRTATSTQATGITAFSDFAVGRRGLNNFLITVPAFPVNTCSPQPITITARNAGNQTITNYTGLVTVSTSSSHGDWTINSANGTLTNSGTAGSGTTDDGLATYQFVAADNGSITLNLTNVHADNLTITVNDSTAGVSSTSGSLQFVGNSFAITNAAIQVAGRNQAMTVAMNGSVSCTNPLAGYTGAKNLKAWLTLDASDPGGTVPTIGALNLPTAVPGANNLSLTFSSGSVSFNLSTTDVGKYVLNLRDDSGTFAGTPGTPIQINGSSATITTRPFVLVVSGIKKGTTNNPGGTATTGSGFIAAADTFEATVGGYRYNAAVDLNNDGVLDAGATLVQATAGGAAPSYRWPTALSAAAPFTPSAVDGGTLATLNNGSFVAGDFSGGTATKTTLSYGEAGSFTMTGTASTFLNTAGANLTARIYNSGGTESGVAGRFFPDHFSLLGSTITPACASGAFTYMGQPSLGYAFVIEARNKSGVKTSNYIDTVYNTGTVAMQAENNNNGTDLSPRLPGPTGSWSAGSYSTTTTATFSRPASPDGPFDSLRIGVRVTDADGPVLASRDMNPTTTGACDPATTCAGKSIGAPTIVRFGRLRLGAASGSQLQPLRVPVEAQYWSGTFFITNVADSCTPLLTTNVGLGNYIRTGAGTTSVTAVTSPLSAGRGTITLGVPAADVRSVDVAVNLGPVPPGTATANACPDSPAFAPAATAANKTYLRGNWCNPPGTYTKDPSTRARFGIRRGSDETIYTRENY